MNFKKWFEKNGKKWMIWVRRIAFVLLILAVLWFSGVIKTPNIHGPITVKAEPTAQPKAQPTAQPTAQPKVQPTAQPTIQPTVVPVVETQCRDGELVVVHVADAGDTLPRTPVGEAERVDIVEMSWIGNGFAGLERAIVVTPRLGPVWMVNLTGLQTIATRGFCGSNENVASWAVQAHVPSLQQASRDKSGDQPEMTEIGVYLLDYENGTLTVIKTGLSGQAERLVERLDVSFHEGDNFSNVPLSVVK